MHLDTIIQEPLIPRYHPNIRTYLSHNQFINLQLRLSILLNHKVTRLEISQSSILIIELQITISKLVAYINEEQRFIKDYLSFYFLLDFLKLLYCFINPAELKLTFCFTRSHLDHIINPEFMSRMIVCVRRL